MVFTRRRTTRRTTRRTKEEDEEQEDEDEEREDEEQWFLPVFPREGKRKVCLETLVKTLVPFEIGQETDIVPWWERRIGRLEKEVFLGRADRDCRGPMGIAQSNKKKGNLVRRERFILRYNQ